MPEIEDSYPNPVETNTKALKTPKGAQQVAYSQFSGPIPPPQFLEQYERLVPGTAKRFLEEPHIEAEHRRALEKQMVFEQIKLSRRGQLFAFALATLSIMGAFFTMYLGYNLAGLGALFMSIAALVGVFFCAQKKH